MKKIICYILLIIIVLGILGTASSYASYKPPKIPKPHTLVGPEDDTRNVLTRNVLPKFAIGAIGFVAAMSLLFLIIAGVKFTMMYGTDETAQNAKKQVIYALAGLIVSLLAYTIVSIISNLKFEGDTTSTPTSTTSTAPPTPAPTPAISLSTNDASLEDIDSVAT